MKNKIQSLEQARDEKEKMSNDLKVANQRILNHETTIQNLEDELSWLENDDPAVLLQEAKSQLEDNEQEIENLRLQNTKLVEQLDAQKLIENKYSNLK
eukprot:UN27938